MFPAKESLCAHARAKLGRPHPVLLFILVTLVFSLGPSTRPGAAAQPNLERQFGRSSRFQNPKRHEHERTVYRIAQVSLGVTSYSDTAVSLGTTYCYRVAAVAGDLVSDFSNLACASPSGVSPSSMFQVAAAKTGTGTGLVSSSPAGIDCGTACSYTYPAGTVVTVATTPSSGSTFRGWSGGPCGGTEACTLTGNGSVTVTATFDSLPTPTPTPGSLPTPTPTPGSLPAYTLAVSKQGPGTVSSSSGESAAAQSVRQPTQAARSK